MKEENVVEVNKSNENQKMVIYFFIYAFLGWILETIFCLVTQAKFMKRGFLYGPLCPMYGFAALVLVLLAQRLNGKGSLIKRIILLLKENII